MFLSWFSGNATVADLCEKCPETLSNICIQLDDKRVVNNWYDLGLKIDINGKQLRALQDSSEYSPAEEVLNTIYTLQPDLLLTNMKEDLKTLNLVAGIEGNIAKALEKFKGMKLNFVLNSFSHRWPKWYECVWSSVREIGVCVDLKFDRRLWKLSPFSIVLHKRLPCMPFEWLWF